MNWRPKHSIVRVLLPFSLFSGMSAAQVPKDLPDVMLKTTSVAAFKNGLGFFMRQCKRRLELSC